MNTEQKFKLKKLLGKNYKNISSDDYFDEKTAEPFIERLQQDIKLAKGKASLVLFYPHMGGQFNGEPGKFSKYVIKKAVEAGCDAVIASHPHIVQRFERIDGVPCFYSLGNFSMSPNSIYMPHENLPDYGLAVHLYVGDTIERISFSIVKMVEKKGEQLIVHPVSKLYEKANQSEKEQLECDVKHLFSLLWCLLSSCPIPQF